MLAPRDIALTTEWRPLAGLGGIAAEWRALAARTAEPNVFYAPEFALHAAAAFAPDAGAVLVRAVEPSRLIGFFPCRIEKRRYGLRLPLLAGWTHPYAPLGTPLVDRDAIEAATAAFLDHVADDDTLPKLMIMNDLAADGAVAAALSAAVARRGGREACVGLHERALLAPGAAREGYVAAVLGDKRRKKLERQARRLARSGEISTVIATAPAEVANALADFFALEAGGWKGAAKTAAAQAPTVRAFMERAVDDLAARRQASVVRLMHAGRAIAAAILLRDGGAVWFWKIAYDEAFAQASPGVLLTLRASEAMLADPTFVWCDSCAAPDHPMANRIWCERRPIVDRLIAVTRDANLTLATRLEALRRGAFAAARRARRLIPGRP